LTGGTRKRTNPLFLAIATNNIIGSTKGKEADTMKLRFDIGKIVGGVCEPDKDYV
jgi:hypothetical protein